MRDAFGFGRLVVDVERVVFVPVGVDGRVDERMPCVVLGAAVDEGAAVVAPVDDVRRPRPVQLEARIGGGHRGAVCMSSSSVVVSWTRRYQARSRTMTASRVERARQSASVSRIVWAATYARAASAICRSDVTGRPVRR